MEISLDCSLSEGGMGGGEMARFANELDLQFNRLPSEIAEAQSLPPSLSSHKPSNLLPLLPISPSAHCLSAQLM